MKKIHITESQLQYIKQKLSEVINQEVSKEIEQGKTPQQISTEFTQKNPNIPKDEVNFTYNQGAMDEGAGDVMEKQAITKKQIKEAKLKNLRENCIRITKKNLK